MARSHDFTLRLLAGASLAVLAAQAQATIITTGNATNFNAAGNLTAVSGAIGGDGPGALDITGGSVLTLSSPTIGGAFLSVGGNQANGTTGQGIINIVGSGSTLSMQGPGNILNIGRFGAGSTGRLQISDGGALEANLLRIARDGADGTMVVDGPTSRVRLSGSDGGTNLASVIVGRDNGTGVLAIRNGAQFTVERDPAATGGNTFVDIGGSATFRTGGAGAIVVDGANSLLAVEGAGANVAVGRFGASTFAQLEVTNGATLRSTFLNVGRDGATGEVLLSGVGSLIALSGSDAAGNGALGIIGRDGGQGSMIVRDGARLTVDGSAARVDSSGIVLGRTAGSTGSLLVDSGGDVHAIGSPLGRGGFTIGDAGRGTFTIGAGGNVLIEGIFSAGLNTGRADTGSGLLEIAGGTLTIRNSDPVATGGMTIGGFGHGELRMSAGATALIANAGTDGGGLLFGNGPTGTSGGTFSGLFTGAGTKLTIDGPGGSMSVGHDEGSSGTVTVQDGAQLRMAGFTIGTGVGSNGALVLTGAATRVDLVNDARTPGGSGVAIGTAGTGRLTITDGARLTHDSSAITAPVMMTVGGSENGGQGGTGTLDISGPGSAWTLTGPDVRFRVGYENASLGGGKPGTGTVNIADGGLLDLGATGRMAIGASAGSTGTVALTGAGAGLAAGSFLGIGTTTDDLAGGTGVLRLGAGTMAAAARIHVGASGRIEGNGTLAGAVVNDGVISPGFSIGTLRITGGNLDTPGGKLVLEIERAGSSWALDRLVFDPGVVPDLGEVELRFGAGIDPVAAVAELLGSNLLLDIDNFLRAELADGTIVGLSDALGGDTALLADFADELGEATFRITYDGGRALSYLSYDARDGRVVFAALPTDPVPASAPASLLILAGALGGLATLRRRERGAAD
jgi:hypothetical protein